MERIVVLLVQPVARVFHDLAKYCCNGSHCETWCCSCGNPVVPPSEDDDDNYRERRAIIDSLEREIQAAVDRCKEKL